jgi:hypothetical protein
MQLPNVVAADLAHNQVPERRSDVLAVVPLVLDRSCFFEPTLSNVTMEARKPVFNDQLGEGDPFVGQAIIPSIPA